MANAILFDFNGVILDDELIHLQLFNEGLSPLGYHIEEAEYFDRYVGFDDVDCFTHVVNDRGGSLDDALLAELIHQKGARYLAMMTSEPPLFSGVAGLITALSSQYPLAIASGALRAEIEGVLEAAELVDHFSAVIAAEDVNHGKPDPEGYQIALDALNRLRAEPISPRNCLVIEDTVAGIAAAKGAGMGCLAVAHTYPAERLTDADLVRESIADVTLEDIRQLLAGHSRSL